MVKNLFYNYYIINFYVIKLLCQVAYYIIFNVSLIVDNS